MAKTHFNSQVHMQGGLAVGASEGGTVLTKIVKTTASAVVPTTAAGALADISLTVAAAETTDGVIVNPANSAVETNIEILSCWVSTAGTVKVRIRNNHGASALTGSTTNWTVMLFK